MIDCSIVIPVKNDARNLMGCLPLLKDFDDIWVVDSGSTDDTARIAEKYGCNVVQFMWNGKFPKKRNWALRNLTFKHPWVLFLDADERVTDAVKDELARKLPSSEHDVYWLYYDNWFLGRMLKHGDAMRKTALLRVGAGEYERIEENGWSNLDMEIHEQIVVKGSAGTMLARMEHHDMRPLESYYAKHEQYANWEANRYRTLNGDFTSLTKRQQVKYSLILKPWFGIVYFCICYFLKCGFLDGHPGFVFAHGKMRYFQSIRRKILSPGW